MSGPTTGHPTLKTLSIGQFARANAVGQKSNAGAAGVEQSGFNSAGLETLKAKTNGDPENENREAAFQPHQHLCAKVQEPSITPPENHRYSHYTFQDAAEASQVSAGFDSRQGSQIQKNLEALDNLQKLQESMIHPEGRSGDNFI